MKITVAVRGVMLDSSSPERSTPFIETHLKTHTVKSDSGFVRGMIWGSVVSLVLWVLLTFVAIRWWI